MTFKPRIGSFFGRLLCGAMERKTGLSKWSIPSRIVAAQFRQFGLAARFPMKLGFPDPVLVDQRPKGRVRREIQGEPVLEFHRQASHRSGLNQVGCDNLDIPANYSTRHDRGNAQQAVGPWRESEPPLRSSQPNKPDTLPWIRALDRA